jgi:hypothetical protein
LRCVEATLAPVLGVVCVFIMPTAAVTAVLVHNGEAERSVLLR